MSHYLTSLSNKISFAPFSFNESKASSSMSSVSSPEIVKRNVLAQENEKKKTSVWNTRTIVAGAVGTLVVVGLYFWLRNQASKPSSITGEDVDVAEVALLKKGVEGTAVKPLIENSFVSGVVSKDPSEIHIMEDESSREQISTNKIAIVANARLVAPNLFNSSNLTCPVGDGKLVPPAGQKVTASGSGRIPVVNRPNTAPPSSLLEKMRLVRLEGQKSISKGAGLI